MDLKDITRFIKERTFVLNIKIGYSGFMQRFIFVKGTKEECKILVYTIPFLFLMHLRRMSQ